MSFLESIQWVSEDDDVDNDLKYFYDQFTSGDDVDPVAPVLDSSSSILPSSNGGVGRGGGASSISSGGGDGASRGESTKTKKKDPLL